MIESGPWVPLWVLIVSGLVGVAVLWVAYLVTKLDGLEGPDGSRERLQGQPDRGEVGESGRDDQMEEYRSEHAR